MNIPIKIFILTVEQTLELKTGSLTPMEPINDIPEFDSLGRLSIIAMCDSRYGFILQVSELDACTTVADFHALVERHATRL